MSFNNNLLTQLREEDEKNDKGEVSAENRSLDLSRIRAYLQNETEITADNFSDEFNIDVALDLLRIKKTRGESLIEEEIVNAQAYLSDLGLSELMNDKNPATFKSTLHEKLTFKFGDDYPAEKEEELINTHAKYLLIRSIAFRSLQIKKETTEKIQEQKQESTKNLKQHFKEFVGKLKKNYRKMEKGEKIIAIGGLVYAAVWLFQSSDNPKTQKIKDGIKTALKIGGGAIAGNYIYRLFTGKTLYEEINEQTAGSDETWEKAFDTKGKKVENLQKSTMELGNQKFSSMVIRYKKAKAAGIKEIRIPGVPHDEMSPREIYLACYTFFSSKGRGVHEMEKKYRGTGATWLDVVSSELVEDPSFEVDEEGMAAATYSTAREGLVRGWNWVVGSTGAGGIVYMRKLYGKITGDEDKEVSDADIKSWVKRFFKNEVMNKDDLKGYIDDKFSHKDATKFKSVLDNGAEDEKTDVMYLKSDQDAMYCVSSVSIQNLGGDKKAIRNAIQKAEERAITFLRSKYPNMSNNMYKYAVFSGGTCMIEPPKFFLFVKMPLPGSKEYAALNKGTLSTIDLAERKDIEVFEGEIKYTDLEVWEQEQFRSHFYMDSGQGADFKKVFKWFSRRYRPKRISISQVKERILANTDERDIALKETGVPQKLNSRVGIYETDYKEKIEDIETEAADEAPAAMHNELIEQMRRREGYKVRLAILGDRNARHRLSYDKAEGDKNEKLLDQYEGYCESYVEGKIKGE